MPLKKPMLVLKKIKHSTEEEKGDINSSRVELDVIGVIRQRILFKTRPKALISSKASLSLLLFSVFLVNPELNLLVILNSSDVDVIRVYENGKVGP